MGHTYETLGQSLRDTPTRWDTHFWTLGTLIKIPSCITGNILPIMWVVLRATLLGSEAIFWRFSYNYPWTLRFSGCVWNFPRNQMVISAKLNDASKTYLYYGQHFSKCLSFYLINRTVIGSWKSTWCVSSGFDSGIRKWTIAGPASSVLLSSIIC